MTDNVSGESIGGKDTILVVEDKQDLLQLLKGGLEEFGYRVMTASDPKEALILSENYQEVIHLLLTDVIMPGMSGKELSDEIVKRRPNIKTLFMSGYTEDVLAPHGVINKGIHFLQKPFTFDELGNRVRYLLSLD